MIEVKDEILNGEPLYRLVDKNGNILFDDLRIEMKTPVIQGGTPLNKVLFHATARNALVYETPSFEISETPVEKERLIPIMSSNSQDGVTLSGNDNAYKMFDGNESDYLVISGGDFQEFIINSTNFLNLENINIKHSTNNASNNNNLKIKLIGVLSSGEEVTLISETSLSNNYTTITTTKKTISNYSYFSKLKLYVRSANADSSSTYACRIYDINISGKSISNNNVTTLKMGGNDVLVPNQIVRIKTSNDTIITSNTLLQCGDDTPKNVVPFIKNNTYVDLIYNGTEFIER